MVGSRIRKALKGPGLGYWMVLPALLAILAIVAYPLAFATYYGFMRVLPGVPAESVGFANYSRMVRDPHFAEALRTTLLFTVTSAGLSFFTGLGHALLLSRPFRGRGAVAADSPKCLVGVFCELREYGVLGSSSRRSRTLVRL